MENFIVRDLAELTIFYGENEAGKSTIMSFIHSILFGFPNKNQTELRYEPKKFSKYGGQLVVTFPTGKAVIERVKGKAAGDVSVILEDGTRGGEELLQQLLSHIDKSLYQAIFSFNLHGLQHMQGMNNADLGRFLFSTGALGTDRLLATENLLQKELDARFKPSGKKPILNEKIAELRQLHKQLKQAEQSNEKYWVYLDEKELLEQKIRNVQLELANKQSRLVKLNEWRRLLPLIKESEELSEEATRLESIIFPDSGVQKLDELKWRQLTCQNKLNQLTSKLSELNVQIEQSMPNLDLLNSELDIHTAVENLPLYEQLIQENKQLELQINQLKQDMEDIQQTLHLKIDEEQVLTCNTSLFMKEKTLQAQRVQIQLNEKKHQLDEQFYDSKKELEQLEEAISKLKTLLLTDEERNELTDQLKQGEAQVLYEQELNFVQNQIGMLKRLAQNNPRQAKALQNQQHFSKWIMMLVFLGLSVWSVFEGLWFVAAVSGLLLLYVVIFLWKIPTEDANRFETEIAELLEKQKVLQTKLAKSKLDNFTITEERLAKDNSNREQLRILNVKREQKNEQYEKVLMSYEQWEHDVRKSAQRLEELGKELGVPKAIAQHFIHDAFQLIEKYKNVLTEKGKLASRQEFVYKEIKQIEARLSILTKSFIGEGAHNIQNAAYLLKQALKREQEKAFVFQEKKQKLIEIEAEIQLLQDEKVQLEQEMQQLFTLAQTENDLDFYKAAELFERKQFVADRLTDLWRQLKETGVDVKELQNESGLEVEVIDMQISLLEQEQTEASEEIVAIQERLAELKYQISLLEEGGTYSELLHLYKLKQSELNEEAKVWAKYAVAKDILNIAVERYKNDRLPKLMEKAVGYLRELTAHQYIDIHPQKNGTGFLIESHDHIFYEPKELSQATSEQVYVALRLALATTLYEKYQFPIIIDDSFVNFDHHRSRKVIDLICGLTGHQILFFTCHQHLLSHFQKGKLIQLKDCNQSMIKK